MLIAYSRTPPSSCAEETRKTLDHCGQGSSACAMSGGRGTISNWWTLRQPLAMDGAQAVGPGVAAADDDHVAVAGEMNARSSIASPATRRFCFVRKSMAKWTPSSSRPSIGRSRGWVAPPQRQTASNRSRSRLGRDVDADVRARPEDDALGLHLLEPAVEVPLLHLEVGDAVAEQAADPVGALEDGDRVAGPGELLGAGQARRAGADDRHRLARQDLGRLRARPSPRPTPGR